MQATTVAIVAACVAGASALITLGGLIWQMTLYRLSGARLRVQLVFEFRDHACTRSLTGTRRLSWAAAGMDSADSLGIADPLGIECVRVRVTNVGRSPVSVENISLDLGRTRWFRSGRRSAVPIAFREPEHPTQEQATGRGQPPVRLEAGAVTSEVFHLWPFVASEASDSGRRGGGTIRASATAAGRRPTLSRRRFAWRFREGEQSWFLDRAVTPDVMVYRELWRHSYDPMAGYLPVAAHYEIMQMLLEGASVGAVRDYLDGLSPKEPSPGAAPRYYGAVARSAHAAFHKAMDRTSIDSPGRTTTGVGAEPNEGENGR